MFSRALGVLNIKPEGYSAIKYRSNMAQNLSINIANDFPNYADLTVNNFIVETLPYGNTRVFANQSDSEKGSINTVFYKPNVTYDPSTGNLTITRPYATYYSGSAASLQGTWYFDYNVYVAENIVSV